MKKLLFLAVLVCFSLQVGAQKLTTKQILDKTAKAVNTSTGVTAKFTFASAQMGTASGDICLKGNKFRTTFADMTVWFDGKTQWAYMKSTDEVNISTPNANQKARMNPYTFITLYKKGYNYTHRQQGGNYVVHLTAQDKKAAMPTIYLTIRKSDFVPTKIVFTQAGKQHTINIQQFKRQPLNDAIFVFNVKQYPDAEIIDLR